MMEMGFNTSLFERQYPELAEAVHNLPYNRSGMENIKISYVDAIAITGFHADRSPEGLRKNGGHVKYAAVQYDRGQHKWVESAPKIDLAQHIYENIRDKTIRKEQSPYHNKHYMKIWNDYITDTTNFDTFFSRLKEVNRKIQQEGYYINRVYYPTFPEEIR